MNLAAQILAAGHHAAVQRKAEEVPAHKLAMCLRRQKASEERIGSYLQEHGPQTVPALAQALRYTKPGLRLVLKSLERRNLVTGAGTLAGYRGREVKLWRWTA